MKIVQTFWCGAQNSNKPLHINGSWTSPEYNWMSWALSTLLLRRHYNQLELYTDEIGKKILIDTLRLPYTKVHIVFHENAIIHPKLFGLAKIHTYSLQQEPFMHVDGDLFLWNPVPQHTKGARLIASNPEVDLFFNKKILDEMEAHFEYIPDHLKNLNQQEHIFSSNAGIIGGSDLTFIRKYCSEANRIVNENREHLEKVDLGLLNMLIEQISLFYLAAQENVKTVYCVPKPVDHPLYKDYWRFADIPEVPMIHPVGGCKQIPYVLYHLARRLQLEFPQMYYHILQCCKNENVQLRNRLYNYLELGQERDGQDLTQANHLKTTIELSGLKPIMDSSSTVYRRTLLTIQHFYPNEKVTSKELEKFIAKKDIRAEVLEIFLLETRSQECSQKLYEEIEKGEIYGSEISNYKNITRFNMESDWTQCKVILKKGVILTHVKKPWGILNTEKSEKALVTVLEAHNKEYCVAQGMDFLTLNIQESYYEGLDVVIINKLKKPMHIEELLVLLLDYFEEDLEIYNPSYQNLIFDSLKRLAFENTITIF